MALDPLMKSLEEAEATPWPRVTQCIGEAESHTLARALIK